MAPHDVHRTIDAVWRIESPRLIAGLARIVRDVGLAEDLAQDALVAALEQWPESGVPDNPGAWLMGTGRHRAIDWLRRSKVLERKQEELGREMEVQQASGGPDLDAALDDEIGDDLLRLIFTACHPVLSPEARIALTLRLVGALSTAEIARAFLVSEATVAQRIVRAKRTLAEARVPFEVPSGGERDARLSSVLEVIYAIFNEGYAASVGDDWMRPALCEEALRLGRILARLVPEQPEVHGLVALMELQASRMRARTGASGEPILLLDQDRSRWDHLLVGRGLAALERAHQLGGGLGPYTLQAAIAACHARARRPEETDWERIVALYDALAQLTPSPVVELNRAVAVAMAFGPAAALPLVDALSRERSLDGYPFLPSVRADLLAKLCRFDEAAEEFERAASLTGNERERRLLLERAARCAHGSAPGGAVNGAALRDAMPGDVEAIAQLWHAGWRDGHVGHVPPALHQHRTLDDFRRRVPPRLGKTIVATVGSGVVGFVVVQDDEIEQIYVAHGARGSGVAAALLERGERMIAARHDRAWLAVVAGNARARCFYQRNGWRDAGAIDYPAETASGSFEVPSRRYEKWLTR